MVKILFILGLLCFSPFLFAAEAFVALADIHFDPFLGCQKKIPCPLLTALQKAPASEWDDIFSQLDKSNAVNYTDTNYALLNSSLSAASKVAHKESAQFVLILGDELGHNFRRSYRFYTGDKIHAGYEAFTKKVLQFVTLKISQSFPNINVYSVLGNNDSYYGDYVTVPQSAFLQDIGVMWGSLIKDDAALSASMQKQLTIDGYYAITIPSSPKLKLIALNTNLFSANAKNNDNADAAAAQLQWLHEVLQQAKANDQKVFIAMHIPMSIEVYGDLRTPLMRIASLWRSGLEAKFKKELAEHALSITGIFTGHLHSDWLHIRTFNRHDEIPMVGVSSISPVFGNVSGFKVIFFSDETFKLLNYVTYTNSLPGEDNWKKEYDFNADKAH